MEVPLKDLLELERLKLLRIYQKHWQDSVLYLIVLMVLIIKLWVNSSKVYHLVELGAVLMSLIGSI